MVCGTISRAVTHKTTLSEHSIVYVNCQGSFIGKSRVFLCPGEEDVCLALYRDGGTVPLVTE